MVIRITEKEQLQSTISSQIAASPLKSAFVFFFGTELPAIDQSWCQDCVISDPWIRSAAKTAGINLIETPVGNREEWKGENGANNFYRKQYNLSVIPTLVKFNEHGEVGRLQDQAECADLDKLKAFFTA